MFQAWRAPGGTIDIYFQGPVFDLAVIFVTCLRLVSGEEKLVEVIVQHF